MAVTVSQGTLLGLQQKTRISSKPYVSFLGVPYAKAPVDDLRFRPPVEHPGWTGELKAFSEGNVSVQYPLMSTQIVGSEDCLYLNIFVPQEEMINREKKAVMVFIHGGAFMYGSASEQSPDYLLDENVIVVTINYRLNVLGFLNFDIDECPGNMGLKDQRFAIKWVKENISAFGGDANNITIFGESAGSASVHGHTLSPQSAGLFQKAIMQSGCLFNYWALNRNHRKGAFELAKHLGCDKKGPKDIVDYLKTVPANDLVECSSKLADDTARLPLYMFIPSIESDAISNPFLPACPGTLSKTASSIPVITGINDMEGIIGVAIPKLKPLIDIQTAEDVKTYFNGHFSEENITKIKNFYFNDHNLECETTKLENVVHVLSDMFFIKDFHLGFEHLLKQNVSPVYNYEFKYDGEINTIKHIMLNTKPSLRKSLKGACHADELNYLFYLKKFGIEPKADTPELKMCRTMCKLWTNFAKTGNPNSPNLSFEWKNTSVDDPKYLSIDGDKTKMVNELLYGSRVKLWESIENRTE